MGMANRSRNRQAYYNRGSNAAWAELKKENEEEVKNIVFGIVLLCGAPLLLLSLLLLVGMLATGGWVGVFISAVLLVSLPLVKALAH